MDIAKLDKMKVVDLRTELQTRGLDTKGVKAVLIERLRAHIEDGDSGGGGVPGTPTPGTPGLCGTPARRLRRTRSMTRSPSPCSPTKKVEPALEPLEEEAPIAVASTADEEEDEEDVVAETEEVEEIIEEAAESEEQVAEEEDEEVAYESAEELMEAETSASNSNAKEDVEEVDEDEEVDSSEKKKLVQEQEVEKQMEVDATDAEIKAEAEIKEAGSNQTEEKSEEVDVKSKEKKEDSAAERRLSRKRSHTASRSRSKSRSRSRSRSPKRRSGDNTGSPAKVAEEEPNPEDEPTIEDKQFGLSWFDSDLHLRIDPVTFTSAKPMAHEIYSLVWSGARANYGVREGKVCYEVRLAEETQMGRSHQFRDEPNVRGFRVGFSLPNSPLILGEAENSFAYCETGRKAVNTEFIDYGKAYKLDDVIGCYLDLENEPCTIKYTLNGEDLGVAFEFDKSILGESDALYPHIVTKGYEFHVNFADNENLLANVERPKRMRRKPRKETAEDKEKETLTDSNQENWKVVDEAKADDDEKPGDETATTESENIKQDKDNAAEDAEDIEMKEVVAEKDEAIKKVNSNEDKVEEYQKQNDDKKKEAIEDESTAENVEGTSAEPSTEDKEAGAEKKSNNETAEANGNDKAEKSENAESGDDKPKQKSNNDEASPTKRQKLDANDKRSNDAESEDEYEEILPEPRDPVSLLPDYELIALIPEEKYVAGPQRPDSRKDCEVILLVGLPGAGKTHWTLKHLAENAEKRYHVIGADALIAKMTIDGVSRKPVHKGRWDRVYELCMNSLSSLEKIANKRRRNFIIDQTNAYASAQRRKMKGFGDFKRIAVVCIPNDEELKRRNAEKTEKGNANAIRESTLNNLRASFTLPSLEFGWFDDIIYTDLSGDEAKEVVKSYNEKGKKAIEANPSYREKRNQREHHQRDDYRPRYDDRRRDFRNDNRWNDRRGGGGQYQGGGGNRWGGNSGGGGGGGGGGYRGGSGWRDERGYGGGGGQRGYDRNRYSSGGGGGGGAGGQQNWMQNNRNRYDDRYNRSSGGGGGSGRYDSYGGGGGGGGSRDYRDRERDRNGGASGGGGGGSGRRENYRSGGGAGNQRDFRPGHRDNTGDSRGGYEQRSAAATSSKYNSNEGYDQYNSTKMVGGAKGGKWSSYGQQQQQQHPQQQGNWQQYQQTQQLPAAQQQYWGYNEMQGYGNQQQWANATPQQQQEWMSWWQQQEAGGTNEANQYWSQYSYATPAAPGGGTVADATKKL